MTKDAETYFTDGCCRCPLGATPDCKVHRWQHELAALRRIILDCGLTEECKWGVPCYTFQNKNILLLSAWNESCSIGFFKGSLLHDEHGILTFAGENSYVGKMLRFTRLADILSTEAWIKEYIFEAVEIEKSGLKVPKSSMPGIPDELKHKFAENPAFKAAFQALTPGRQRGYLLHFSQPKQSRTRESRIEKYISKILSGEGLHDRYGA